MTKALITVRHGASVTCIHDAALAAAWVQQLAAASLAKPAVKCPSAQCITAQTLSAAPRLSCRGSVCDSCSDSRKCAKSKCLPDDNAGRNSKALDEPGEAMVFKKVTTVDLTERDAESGPPLPEDGPGERPGQVVKLPLGHVARLCSRRR